MELSVPAPRRADTALLADTAMLYDFTPMNHGLRGYLWVFPVPGDRLNVGLMHYPARRVSGPQLLTWLRLGLAELGIELPLHGARSWPVWGYHPRKAIARPRVLAVGDAAGIDALTGEGIAVAMEHAIVAGDAIERAFAGGDFSFAGYRREIRRAVVGRELALDRLLSYALYGMKSDRWWRFWLSLVLYDATALELYAARVSGSQVLADQQTRLLRVLPKHLVRFRRRMRDLDTAGRTPGVYGSHGPNGLDATGTGDRSA
jgi:flavin-dependent dehydrogenase